MTHRSVAAIALVVSLAACRREPEAINRPPVLVPPGDVWLEADEPLAVQLEATDPDGDVVGFDLVSAPPGAALDGAALTWTPAAGDAGSHGFVVSATDGGDPPLTDYAAFSVTVAGPPEAPINHPPVAVPIPDQRIAPDQRLVLALQASDPDGDALAWSALALPDGASFDTDSFSWTPTTGDAGLHHALFEVADDGEPPLTDLLLVDIDVIPPEGPAPENLPPSFFGIPAPGLTEPCVPFTASFEALDPEGGTLRYSSPNLPPGATLTQEGSTAVLSWTPTADDEGLHYLNVYAIDDGDPPMADSLLYTVTVSPRPAWIDPLPAWTAPGGETLQSTISWSHGACHTLQVDALPSGASFDPATDTLTWPTTPDDFGLYDITFAVTNPRTVPETVSAVQHAVVQFEDTFDALSGYDEHNVNLDWCCFGDVVWEAADDPVQGPVLHGRSDLEVDVFGHAFRAFDRSALPMSGVDYELVGWDVVVGPACGSGGQMRLLDFAVTDPEATWPAWGAEPEPVVAGNLPDGTAGTQSGSSPFDAPTSAVTLDLLHLDASNICTVDTYWDYVRLTPW